MNEQPVEARPRSPLYLVDFKPISESKVGEMAARFDIGIGATPQDSPNATR